MRSIFRLLVAALACASLLTVATPKANAATFTPLTLQNGWTNSGTNTRVPAFAVLNDIVFFKGGMRTPNASAVAFTLPPAVRPLKEVSIPIDLYAAKNGYMRILTNGVATVQEGVDDLGNAKIFTSLEGAFFARNANGFTNLSPQNGWGTAYERTPAAKAVNGVVYLKGAVRANSSSTTSNVPFTLPTAFRPAKEVDLDIDVCGGHSGQLEIAASGQARLFDESGSNTTFAKCLTSLDGVSFARNATGFTPLTLQNGWKAYSGSHIPAVKNINGIVHFEGAISNGTNATAFTLPPALRPAKNVFVDVVMCGTKSGRITVPPTGVVTVRATTDFTYAQCNTSLDGALFAL